MFLMYTCYDSQGEICHKAITMAHGPPTSWEVITLSTRVPADKSEEKLDTHFL